MKRLITILAIVIGALILFGNNSHADTYSEEKFVMKQIEFPKICEFQAILYYQIKAGEQVFIRCDSISGVIKQLSKSFEINMVNVDSIAVQSFGAFNRAPIKLDKGKILHFGKYFDMN